MHAIRNYLLSLRALNCEPPGRVMLNAIVDFSIIIGNLGGVLGLSGLLMLNYFFPSAEGCAAGAELLFQILASLGAIVVVAVLIQHADQIAPGAWAFVASSPPS